MSPTRASARRKRRVVGTAGPPREHVDPERRLSIAPGGRGGLEIPGT